VALPWLDLPAALTWLWQVELRASGISTAVEVFIGLGPIVALHYWPSLFYHIH
jgi:hypothetical protein